MLEHKFILNKNFYRFLRKLLTRLPSLGALFYLFLFGFGLFWVWYVGSHGDRSFGYDVGLYRHFILGYGGLLAHDPVVPFGFSFFSNLLLALNFSVDGIMYGWFVGFFLGIVFLFFVYVKKRTEMTVAFFGCLLLMTSITFFELAWWYYYRQVLALFTILFMLIGLEYQRWWIVTLSVVIVGTIHPLSFVPLALLLFSYFFLHSTRRRSILVSAGVGFFLALLFNWGEWIGYITPLFSVGITSNAFLESGKQEFTGQFLDPIQFLSTTYLYLPFALYGVGRYVKKYLEWSVFLLTSLLLLFFGVVFAHRMLVYVNLSLIIFAAIGLRDACRWLGSKRIILFFSGIYVIFLLIQYGWYVTTKEPYLTQEEWVAVQELHQIPAQQTVIVLSSYYAPWLYGFSDHYIVAPGMLDDRFWSYHDWVSFWYSKDGTSRLELFQRLQRQPEVVYLFIGPRDEKFRHSFLSTSYCTPITMSLLRCEIR